MDVSFFHVCFAPEMSIALGVRVFVCVFVCVHTLIQETKWKRYWSDYTYCKWDIFFYLRFLFFFFCRFCSMPVCAKHSVSHFSFDDTVEMERESSHKLCFIFQLMDLWKWPFFIRAHTHKHMNVYVRNQQPATMQCYKCKHGINTIFLSIFFHNLSHMPLLRYDCFYCWCCCFCASSCSPMYWTQASIEHIDLILINQFFST